MKYVAALVLCALGVALLKSAPGKIIPYLREHAKNSGDFASGLAVAMVARWAMGVLAILAGAWVALEK